MKTVSRSWLAQNLKVHESIIDGWIKRGLLEVFPNRYIMAGTEGEENERITVIFSFPPVETENAETGGPGPCKVVKFDKMKGRK